jgi:hypothetical protein
VLVKIDIIFDSIIIIFYFFSRKLWVFEGLSILGREY